MAGVTSLMQPRRSDLTAMSNFANETVAVRGLRRLLECSSHISYFYFLRKVTHDWKNPNHVDIYAISWMFLSIICFALSFVVQAWPIVIAIASGHYGRTSPHDYRRLVILVLCNYLETICWFATWYSAMIHAGILKVAKEISAISIFRESVVSTVGNSTSYFDLVSPYSAAIVTIHNAVGLLLTVILLTRFVAMLPRAPAVTENQ